MLRTKIVALLLAICVTACVPTFSASAEEASCRISVRFFGGGYVTMNDVRRPNSFSRYFSVGENVTMTAEPREGFEFLFWVNNETRRIISTDPTYSFYAATYAEYEAVFDETESTATADGWHTIIYLSEGENILFMEPVELEDRSYFEDSVASINMHVSGRVWTGWDKSVDEVASTPGRVYVHPSYDTTARFTVTYSVNGGETSTRSVAYLSRTTVQAPAALETGEPFSYWIARAKDVNAVDEIASFYPDFEFVVVGDVTLDAVYGAADDSEFACRISADFPSFNDSTIALFAEHCVKKGNSVLQHGMLITKDLEIGNFPDTFVITPGESKIFKLTAKDTAMAGNYRVDIGNWTAIDMGTYQYYPLIFARAYLIVRDSSGVTRTVYSSIYCVNYEFGTGTGGGDNYDDPLG